AAVESTHAPMEPAAVDHDRVSTPVEGGESPVHSSETVGSDREVMVRECGETMRMCHPVMRMRHTEVVKVIPVERMIVEVVEIIEPMRMGKIIMESIMESEMRMREPAPPGIREPPPTAKPQPSPRIAGIPEPRIWLPIVPVIRHVTPIPVAGQIVVHRAVIRLIRLVVRVTVVSRRLLGAGGRVWLGGRWLGRIADGCQAQRFVMTQHRLRDLA